MCIRDRPKFVPFSFDSKLYRSRLLPGDVLINLVGASIGRSCRMPNGVGPANINQAVCLLRPESEVDSVWLGHCLQWPTLMAALTGDQVESARANVSLSDVRRFGFPMPVDAEKIAISDRLSAIDLLSVKEVDFLAKLQLQKSGLMQDLLTGKVRVNVE